MPRTFGEGTFGSGYFGDLDPEFIPDTPPVEKELGTHSATKPGRSTIQLSKGTKPNIEAYSTVPVSTPVVVPEVEEVQMNGFAWSGDFGLLVAFGERGEEAVDALIKLREPLETYIDFSQGIRDTDTR